MSSKAEAELSIASTHASLQKKVDADHSLDDSDTDGDEAGVSTTIVDDVEDDSTPARTPTAATHTRTTSIAEDVIARKGGYGRFAQKWFSKKGWTADQRRNLGMTSSGSSAVSPTDPALIEESTAETAVHTPADGPDAIDVTAALLPKLLRTTQILFGSSQSFFFSYEYDLTRSFATRNLSSADSPLYTRVDPLFWWNHNIMQPFVDSGQSTLVMPLIQGFVGQKSFEMDPNPPKPVITLAGVEKSSVELVDLSTGNTTQHNPSNLNASDPEDRISGGGSTSHKLFLLTLISRRSIKRAGLRYLRRGVDDEGFTANSVETEQILSDPYWNSKIYSFLQVRGSIPIFFSQSPYSFKPIPQLQHSEDTSYQAFKRHFQKLSDSYGSIQVISLVEKHGAEAIVGDRYAKFIDRLNDTGNEKVGFEWFDFHSICRGMKFENVSILMDTLSKKLDFFGETVEKGGKRLSQQKGVLRINCMDCLDRTNVVQSACGLRALESQLKAEGIDMTLQPDQTTSWFNTVWADNGDAISKQYASTAALKGDFTRTRKRNFQGALKDMGNSISRFYSG